MPPMARCAYCQETIRKAEVQYRILWSHGSISRVTVHESCGGEPGFFPVTPELELLAELVARHSESQRQAQELRRAVEKARADDTAMYICRLELETDRHPARPCGAPLCPAVSFFSWVPASAYQEYRQRSSGYHQCNMCGRPAQGEHNKPECHTCSDWGGCGKDCTLSRVYCEHCGTSQTV